MAKEKTGDRSSSPVRERTRRDGKPREKFQKPKAGDRVLAIVKTASGYRHHYTEIGDDRHVVKPKLGEGERLIGYGLLPQTQEKLKAQYPEK